MHCTSMHNCPYLCFDQLLECNGLLRLELLLLFQLLLEDKTGREGVAVDTLLSAWTLPEPAIDALFNRMEEVLTDLR